MTLTAYLVAALVTRVMLDNPLLRIPVMAGAAGFQHARLPAHARASTRPAPGSPLGGTIAETVAFSVIWTTVAGTAVAFVLDLFFNESTRVRQRRAFAFRRRLARRGLGRRKYSGSNSSR